MNRRTAMGLVSVALLPSALAGGRDSSKGLLRVCRQLLRVETPGWGATTGTLTLWVRNDAGGAWRQDGRPIPVVLGRAGMRWGRGWHQVPEGVTLKREGDGCSPAGIFNLDTAFGSMPASQSGVKHWPWRQMTSAHAGVDDPRSRHYNRIVDAAMVKNDWSSAENMVPKSGVYRRGIVVRHNWDQVPAAGSCIFLHIRSGPRSPTAGCTAMTEKNLRRLLGWLDPARNPLLVPLPRVEWAVRAPAWGLPGAPAPAGTQKSKKGAPKVR